MVQEFHVVRCFKCQSFQVQQVKKVNRWSCKLCGEKQTLLKEFGRGSGADCRRHVQKLNAMRGAVMQEQDQHTWEQVEEAEEETDDQVTQTHVSRWSKYLDPPEEAEPEEEDVLMDRHSNKMSDRKRKRSCTPEQSKRSSLNPVRPSATTRASSLNQSSPPNKSISPPRLQTGLFSRWTSFLSSDCQVRVGEGTRVGGVTDQSCQDIVSKPRPQLPVSSMFESGDDFIFDEFLTEPRL